MSTAGPPAPAPAAPPLVGRERERAALREALSAAIAGRGSLVLIGGEAGIGKTALAEGLLAEAADRGATVLVGRCYDLAETPPYGPWVEALERAPRGGDRPAPPDLDGSGAASQAALFTAVRDYFVALAARRPLVLLLEDLHWSDPASAGLLRFLARHLAELPVLLVVTYRADEVARQHPLYALLPLLVREARAARLDLRPLGEDHLRALVRRRYALPPPDEDRLVAHLRDHAEGNPFYAGELLRTLEEERALARVADRWALGDLAGAAVPPLLRQVLDARVDRLGGQARDLLAVAAVIGQEVPLDLWATIAGAGETGLLDTAERAVAARLLDEAGDGAAVRFHHALIRAALYEGIGALRRRGLHRRAADALIAVPAPDPDAVAYHLRQAGDPRAAEWLDHAAARARRAYAWLTAAERLEAALALAERRGVPPGERGWLLVRVGLLRRHADTAAATAALERAVALAEGAADPLLAASARFNRGELRIYAMDYLGGVAEMAAAVGALEELWPPGAAALARLRGWGLADDLDHHRGALANWYGGTGRFAEALAVGEPVAARGLAAATGWLDNAFAPDALRGVGLALAFLGRPDAALVALVRHMAARRAVGDVGNAALSAAILLWCVLLPYRADDLAGRRRAAAEMERLWARAGGAWSTGPPGLWAAPLLLLEGRWAEVRALAPAVAAVGPTDRAWFAKFAALVPLACLEGDRAAATALMRAALPAGPATEPGALRFFMEAPVLPLVAVLAVDAGDLAEARAWLACHDRLLAASGAVLGRAENALGWAAYHRAAGDPANARRLAEAALARATEPRQPLALLAAHRLLGELATAAGHYVEVQVHLDAALTLADACAAPYERALTLLALAELRAAEGQQDVAIAPLTDARALLEPLEARPALARADALAARLASPPPVQSEAAILPFGLTEREAAVLRLVVAGLTNPQVAERLFVTSRTVNAHLTHIYTKLGVEGRAAAIRVALDHDLR